MSIEVLHTIHCRHTLGKLTYSIDYVGPFSKATAANCMGKVI